VCGRFTTTTPAEDLARYFNVDEVVLEEQRPRWNVAPTDTVAGIADRDGVRRMGAFRWGLVPFWAKDPSVGSRMINARGETIRERPAYARPFERRRCIVPADGYYEWRSAPDGAKGKKQPFHISRTDGEPLALAALWDSWRPRRGSDDGRLVSCALITTAANDLLRPLHDRMPVVLPAAAWDAWLDPANDDLDGLAALLVPAPDALLEAVPVAGAVGDVRNDGPELLEVTDPGGRIAVG
jgi:putative SOS response-associated peptidase YedK